MAKSNPKRGKTQSNSTYLIVDARERAVIPFVETALENFQYVQKQVNTGDYLICRGSGAPAAPPTILACLERKTHEDFAASFKDGRYENVNKMLELRARTGCQLYYIIEGAAFPSPSRRFARIPFANILAAITRLMVRHGIFIVQTEDEQHTAKRICDLMVAFEETKTPSSASDVAPASDDIAASDDTAAQDDTAPSNDTASPDDTAASDGGTEEVETAVPEFLTGRIDQPDCEVAVNMWARLRGISVVFGKILTREFSVADLAAGRVSIERIRALKTSTGRLVNADAVASLLSVRSGSTLHAAKLVSGVHNISPILARHILDNTRGLSALCSREVGALSIMLIPRGSQSVKLGEPRARRILKLLHYCENGSDSKLPDLAGGHILGGAPPTEPVAPKKEPAAPKKDASPGPVETTVFDLVYPDDAR
jgi:ERCC4-type nuclease